ncbi:MAG: DnaA regulatory inactivator Hda [Burkholderiaceae bacterium]|jgi:DnaA family protein|nr:DnaA regulatory inactivator Hda [Burkholderiaceae bacterium]
MSQLTLDLLPEVAPTLDNFIVGANSECLQQLRALRDGQRTHRFIYLWGLPGCGRSHLARALASATAQIAEADPVFPDVPADDTVPGASSLLVVDDVHLLGPDEQIALFRQFIAAAARPQRAIVTTGDRPPLALALRDDLRSRLGAGLVFELQGLDDDARALALEQAAQARGVVLSADLIPWLLTHHSRDMRVLLATFEALDRYALARKRPITLPLLREWLAEPAGKML